MFGFDFDGADVVVDVDVRMLPVICIVDADSLVDDMEDTNAITVS